MKLFTKLFFTLIGFFKKQNSIISDDNFDNKFESSNQIEIERAFIMDEKFCVLKLPKLVTKAMTYSDITNIYPEFLQCRYRIETKGPYVKYYSTIKKQLSDGMFSEEEKIVSKKEIENVLKMPGTITLKKKRFFGVIDGYNYCIDLMGQYEKSFYRVEIEKISNAENKHNDYCNLMSYEIPEWLNKYISAEVTGNKEFSNRALALKLKNDEE